MKIEWFQYFQILSLLLAIIHRRGLKLWRISAFIPLLATINAIEITGVNYKYFGWSDNYFLYNIYLVVNEAFMLYIFSRMLILDKRMREIFQIISVLCMAFMLLNITLIKGFHDFNTSSLVLTQLINIFVSSIVLFQLVYSGDHNRVLFKEPFFWINAGTLFFSLGAIVLFGLNKYIRDNNIQIEQKTLYHALVPILNVILYSAWGYGFIKCSRTSS
ncbi:MAG: hypothetical protein DI538_19665 [Azospira oryzae]|nr:MAG: hypothetical protein DI538_19665 [Azospira oryzae]